MKRSKRRQNQNHRKFKVQYIIFVRSTPAHYYECISVPSFSFIRFLLLLSHYRYFTADRYSNRPTDRPTNQRTNQRTTLYVECRTFKIPLPSWTLVHTNEAISLIIRRCAICRCLFHNVYMRCKCTRLFASRCQ